MDPAKKKGLSVLIGIGKHGDDEDDEGDASGGGKEDAATEILEAIKDDDAAALSQALVAFLDLHSAGEDESEDDEDHEDEGA